MELVNKNSLSVLVTEHLKKQIFVFRAYVPGDYIREVELAANLGVSRGPVRDSIKRLTDEGVLEACPWRGARVVRMSERERKDALSLVENLQEHLLSFFTGQNDEHQKLSRSVREDLERTICEMQSMLAQCAHPDTHYELFRETEQHFWDVLLDAADHVWTKRAFQRTWSCREMAFLDADVHSVAECSLNNCRSVLERLKECELA